MNQPHNTPLNADDELREILDPEFLDSAGAKEEHFYPALNKWRKKHELQAKMGLLKVIRRSYPKKQTLQGRAQSRLTLADIDRMIGETKQELESL